MNSTMDLSFVSLKDIYGTDHIYPSPYLAQYQGKLVKAFNMDSFVAYTFDGRECRVYDDNKILYLLELILF